MKNFTEEYFIADPVDKSVIPHYLKIIKYIKQTLYKRKLS